MRYNFHYCKKEEKNDNKQQGMTNFEEERNRQWR